MMALPVRNLRVGDVVMLSAPGKARVKMLFECMVGSGWQVRSESGGIANLRGEKILTVSYIRSNYLHTGVARLLSHNENQGVCLISEPSGMKSRQIRRWDRVNADLSTAIILCGAADKPFSYRSDNRILNISEGGALIACRQALPVQAREVLMLTCFDRLAPHKPDEQLYMRSRLVRMLPSNSTPDFPYAYGFQFRNMFPYVKERIQRFVDEGE